MEKYICLNCKKEFKSYKHAKHKYPIKYCSYKCKGLYVSGTKNVPFRCYECGKESIKKLCDYKKCKYNFCSVKCQIKNKDYQKSKGRIGWDNKNFKGLSLKTRHLRKLVVYKIWRKSVLERDNYTCQHCGSKDSLEVHHIMELRNNNGLALNVENGLVLCNSCHRKTDNYAIKAVRKGNR